MTATSQTDEHPVEKLAQTDFDSWAAHCKLSLTTFGYAFARLTPGDGTVYRISIVRPIEPRQWQAWEFAAEAAGSPPPHPSTGSYHVATQYGPLYEWDGQAGMHWDYVRDKWISGDGGTANWTARVLARFLNTLAGALAEVTS